eukprot:TRINITY_DN6750_c0_g2_i1.p1 TRINITY_DN6750_c0_g2~~TRINITY_DN6750_c0_g2_i1.p1  ORF type:complete len:178 (-),score=49.23 TRINITY_DN6750_c0_g2_i1:283-816(-)
MGNKQGSLSREEVDKLQEATHFDAKELRAMHKQFYADAPNGEIPREDFLRTMEQMGIKDAFLRDLVFNAFDENQDGSINFNEFILALSVMTRGTADEKLEFAFSMYDLDHNGCISKDEMVVIMESFCKLVGGLVSYGGDAYQTPTQFVDKFFNEMDENKDGVITLEVYFMQFSHCNS